MPYSQSVKTGTVVEFLAPGRPAGVWPREVLANHVLTVQEVRARFVDVVGEWITEIYWKESQDGIAKVIRPPTKLSELIRYLERGEIKIQ